VECEPSATFGDVKDQLWRKLSVPPDKQRLLCNGKERKNAAESLSSAGVTAKSKLMLMLPPGFTLPLTPTLEEATSPLEEVAAPSPVDVEGKLPLTGGTVAQDGASAVVHVRQGRCRYHVRVPQGLAAATFGELGAYLATELLPPGTPASELRFISRGKTVAAADILDPSGLLEMSVMLLFREGYHVAAEGANWLRDQSGELAEAEAELEKLGRRIEANFSDAETAVRLAEVSNLVETLKQSVESVRVSEAKLPEMEELRRRVLAADTKLQSLRKSVRL